MPSPSDVAVHSDWFKAWFNHPAYLKLYAHRSLEEAEQTIATLLKFITIPNPHPKALDIACGSGRHAVALAENGFHVTANDLSKTLLAQAQKLAEEKKLTITFTHTDMREIDFENEFDLIVQLFTSFGYFENDDEDEVVLNNVARALKPGGWYVLDFLNASLVRKTLQPETRRSVDGFEVLEQRVILGERVVKSITLHEGGKTHRFMEAVRLYSMEDLTAMLAAVGLHVRCLLGNYQGEAFLPDTSPRLIFIAQK
ncbi:MAG: class I SAM-dependent methyltransferase [Chloroherpetonaceae bacterium]